MKDLNTLNQYRHNDFEKEIYGGPGDSNNGAFEIRSPTDKALLFVIASDGGEWDHVSVSRKNRCPNWPEMEHVKRLFFKDDEAVMQIHVPVVDHINVHPYTLHIWRPQQLSIPLPPKYMVAL